MNDPNSYEHIETQYIDNRTTNKITVIVKFRGNNAFGGKIINIVKAEISLRGEVLTAKTVE